MSGVIANLICSCLEHQQLQCLQWKLHQGPFQGRRWHQFAWLISSSWPHICHRANTYDTVELVEIMMAVSFCSGKSGDSNDDAEIFGKETQCCSQSFFLVCKYWTFMLYCSCNVNNSRIITSRRNNICSEKYIGQSGFWLQYAEKSVNFTWFYHNAQIAF